MKKGKEITMLRFHILNLACGGCVKSATKALQSVDPNARIETNLSVHEMRVESTADTSSLRAALAKAGYPAEQDDEGRAN